MESKACRIVSSIIVERSKNIENRCAKNDSLLENETQKQLKTLYDPVKTKNRAELFTTGWLRAGRSRTLLLCVRNVVISSERWWCQTEQ